MRALASTTIQCTRSKFKEQVGVYSYKICQSGFFLDGRKQQLAFSETTRLPTGRFAISCFMTFCIHCCKRANTKTSLVFAFLRAQLQLFQDLLFSTRIRKFYIVPEIGFYWIGKFTNNYKYYMDGRSLQENLIFCYQETPFE